jgi:hypothetical protein
LTTHIDFVGILFIIFGLLAALVGLSTLALGVAAVALMASASRGGPANPSTSLGTGEFAAGLTAATFAVLAIIAIIWGAAHVAVGVPLRRRKPSARLCALMLGSIDLILLPYGTALGIYALWTLLTEDGKRQFQ